MILLSSAPAHATSRGLCGVDSACSTPSPLARSCVETLTEQLVQQRPGLVAVPLCSDDGTSASAPAPITPLEGGTIELTDEANELWLSIEQPQRDKSPTERSLDPLGPKPQPTLPPGTAELVVLSFGPATQLQSDGARGGLYRPPRRG